MAKANKVVNKSVVKTKTKLKNNIVSKGAKNKIVAKSEKAVAKAQKLGVPKVAYKKSELLRVLAEQTALTKKDLVTVLEAIQSIAVVHLVKSGPGQFTLPGLLKLTAKTKPATKAKKGLNPFTGEEITINAKPARRVVRVRVLKKFKNELE